jgi:hypothetical protein
MKARREIERERLADRTAEFAAIVVKTDQVFDAQPVQDIPDPGAARFGIGHKFALHLVAARQAPPRMYQNVCPAASVAGRLG